MSEKFNVEIVRPDNKILNEDSMIESVMAFKRAGACAIVTYFAMEIAKNIQNSN